MEKTCQIIHVDFEKRKVEKVENNVFTVKYDFSNFQDIPQESKYYGISDRERFEISEKILEEADFYDFSELMFFANNGVLDYQKISETLGLGLEKDGFGPSIA